MNTTSALFDLTAQAVRQGSAQLHHIDRVLRDSALAQQCMEVEEALSVVRLALDGLRSWDIGYAKGVLSGKRSSCSMPVDEFRELFNMAQALRSVAVEVGERYERHGFEVRELEQIRAVCFNDFAVLEIIREMDGESVEPGKHMRQAFNELKPRGK